MLQERHNKQLGLCGAIILLALTQQKLANKENNPDAKIQIFDIKNGGPIATLFKPLLQMKKFREKLNPLVFGTDSGDFGEKSNPSTADNTSPKRQNVYGETEVCRIRQKRNLSDTEGSQPYRRNQ